MACYTKDSQNDAKPDELIPIRAFSDITNVSVSTLRYYDEIGLFTPAMRTRGGYRYYSAMQIVTIKFIRVLLDCGFSLSEVCELSHDRSPESMARLMHGKTLELDREMSLIMERRAVLDVFQCLICEGLTANEERVSVEKMQALPIITGTKNTFFSDEFMFYKSFVRFLKETPNVNHSFPVGGLFRDMAAFEASPSTPDNFFSIDPAGKDEKPAGTYVVGYTRGYYGDTNGLEKRMSAFIDEQRLEVTGPVYNIFLHDEISLKDPRNFLKQSSVRVKLET